MSDSLTLKEGEYGKLGVLHCGVIRGFKVHCAIEPIHTLNDGEMHVFSRVGVTAKRVGDEVLLSKTEV